MATGVCDNVCNFHKKVNVPLFILVCFFAMSSWIDINGIWVELPLFVRYVPEGWKISSYVVIVIQIANMGPLLYTIAKTLRPERVKEWPLIIVVISVALVACILLIFFWHVTTTWSGVGGLHSTGLLVLSLFLSVVDCTSSVLYITYISSFHSVYMTALFVGEGMGGLLAAILGLAQLTDEDQWVPSVVRKWVNTTQSPPSLPSSPLSSLSPPSSSVPFTPGWVNMTGSYVPIYAVPRFSIEVFLILISILLFISLLSFLTIHFLPYFNKFRHVQKKDDEKSDKDSNLEPYGYYDEDSVSVFYAKAALMLLITAWINGLTNGVLPSLQTYSSKSYSNLTYNMHVKLSVLVNPIACFLTLFIRVRKAVIISVLTAVGTILTAYQIALAALSPDPPSKGQTLGVFFAVFTQVLLTAIFSYTKVCIAIVMSTFHGRHWLLFYGLSTQVGSLVGAIITFCLVNFTNTFEDPF